MYGEIDKNNFHAHMSSFVEGKIYKIERFTVCDARPKFKAVDSRFMIQISVHTIVTEQQPQSTDIPLYTYRTTEFSDISSLVGETKSFVGTFMTIYLTLYPTFLNSAAILQN